MLYTLTMVIIGYNHATDQTPSLPRASKAVSMISDNFNRGRRDLFQMCFTAYGGQVASHHGDNQVAKLGKAKFTRMVLKQIY